MFVAAVAYPWRTVDPKAPKWISPANPPFPWARNLPFQAVTGSHTSIAMDESALGVASTTTRQNEGTVL